MPEAWLEVGGPPLPLAEQPSTFRVRGATPLKVRGTGWQSGEALQLGLGEQEYELMPDASGCFELSLPSALLAVAGTVLVTVADEARLLQARLDVKPTRLAEESLFALLDALEELAPGLAGDLGGRSGLHRVVTSPTEATLRLLEHLEGPVVAACSRLRSRPIARHRVELRAVARDSEPRSPAELRWLARNPWRSSAARAMGRAVGVARTEDYELDVPENRGVLGLFAQLERLASALAEVLDNEEARLIERRPEREAFRTQRGNLFVERDLPRLHAIERKRTRVASLRRNLDQARRSLGFPPTLRPTPFARSAKVERHPGYWALFRAWLEVRSLLPLRPMPAFLPLRNTDELYELWTTLAFIGALERALDRPLLEQLQVESGWFARLPPGELCRASLGHDTLGAIELVVHREPAYAFRGGGDIQRLLPGGAWRPDIALEVRAGGQPVALHLFDAKHSLRHGYPDGAPVPLFEGVWLKYVDSIGRGDGTPLVHSCWVLYPGGAGRPLLRSPGMLGPAWPPYRPYGGSIPLVPGRTEALDLVLRAVLQGTTERLREG